jgi:hypothetical protein
VRRLITTSVLGAFASFVIVSAVGAQQTQWTTQFGTSGFDVYRAIGADDSGVYALGAMNFGGPGDVFLRKFDNAGNELWTAEIATAGDDFLMAGEIAIDDGAIYVAGPTDGTFPGETNAGASDVWVQKYDAAGNLVWTDQFGSAGFENSDGLAFAQGRLYVIGLTNGTMPGQTSGGSWDAFVRAYDTDGNHIWTRQFGGAGSDDFHAVAADRNGVYGVGSVTTGPDFTGDGDALVVKFDLDGNVEWTDQFGVSFDEHLEGAAVKHGALYVAGYTFGTFPGETSAGGSDNIIRKYDADGNVLWTDQFGTSGQDFPSFRGLATDGRGVYITGNAGGTLPGQTSAGGRDAFVRQYSHDGDVLWTLQWGTTGDDRGIAVTVGENDDVYVAGRTSGAFPGFTYAGGTDGFVTKIVRTDD